MFGFGRKKAAAAAPEDDKGAKRSAPDLDKELAKLGIFAAPVADDDDDGDLEDELLALIGEDDDPSPSPRRRPQSRSPQPPSYFSQEPHSVISPEVEKPPPVRPPPPRQAAQQPQPQILEPTRVESPVENSSLSKAGAPQAFPQVQTQIQAQTQRSPVPPPKPRIVTSPPSVDKDAAPQPQPQKAELLSDLPADLFKAPPPAKTVIQALEQRLVKYKSEVEKAKAMEDGASKARRMGRIVKQYEDAIKAHKGGKAVAFDELPTPPGFPPIPGVAATPLPNLDSLPGLHDSPSGDPISDAISQPRLQPQPQPQRSPVPSPKPRVTSPPGSNVIPASAQSVVPQPQAQPTELVSDLPEDIFKAPPPPKTVLQALEQRLVKYKSEVEKAKAMEDGASKARRMGRIVKQYEDAIKAHKGGKPVPFDELPTPPGFPPIPGQAAAPLPSLDSLPGLIDGPAQPSSDSSPPKPAPGAGAGAAPVVRGGTKSGGKLTLQEKQLAVILSRQKAFKSAALAAKQRGDLAQARELLRTAKGFDKLIQVSQAGLPVDMATLPAGPDSIAALESEDFEVVTASDCIPANATTAEVFMKLEEDLKEQLKKCMRTRDHFKSMGDIGSANRFEHLALDSKRDLDALRLAARKGDVLPSYHYETRIFSITECNSDLGEDEIEVCILKGINYKAGTNSDTFLKVEFPYPTAEQAQTNRSGVVSNAEYDATYKFSINRSARNFHRFVHRHGVKIEVWSKGGVWYSLKQIIVCRRGFLRSSTLMGTATVKLLPLETKCAIHEAFDVLEGRKSVGKLEVKIRVREPILTKQISQQKQKWLSIDRT